MNAKANTRSLFHCIAMIFALSVSPSVWGDDAKPASAEKEKSAEKTTKEPVAEEKPKERSVLEKLGDELLKEVDDTPGADPNKPGDGSDKMERAVKGMRSAGGKLDEGITAGETQKIQKQVIKDLEDLIDQLENPPPDQGGGGGGGGGGSGGGSSSSRNRGGGGSSSQRMRRPQGAGSRGMGSKQQQTNAEQKSGEHENSAGTESSKQTREDRKAAEEAERRRKLEMDVWGHLPAHLREELLSTYGNRMLPKYEQLVKQFYEALSTQGDSKK